MMNLQIRVTKDQFIVAAPDWVDRVTKAFAAGKLDSLYVADESIHIIESHQVSEGTAVAVGEAAERLMKELEERSR